MNSLQSYFPGCILTTEQIRENIKRILNIEDDRFFCYRCFEFIPERGRTSEPLKCNVCYNLYCVGCSRFYKERDNSKEIDSKKCIYCEENRKFLIEHGF